MGGMGRKKPCFSFAKYGISNLLPPNWGKGAETHVLMKHQWFIFNQLETNGK
jgi:hypothetical protein